MRLLLMRHGDALRWAATDHERPLSEYGRQEISASATWLAERGITPERICCSPLFRAWESASIVQSLLPGSAEVEIWQEVVPGGQCEVVAQRLNHAASCATLVVSHQPFVSRMINWLTGEERGMETGMIVCIQADVFDRYSGELEWTGP